MLKSLLPDLNLDATCFKPYKGNVKMTITLPLAVDGMRGFKPYKGNVKIW